MSHGFIGSHPSGAILPDLMSMSILDLVLFA